MPRTCSICNHYFATPNPGFDKPSCHVYIPMWVNEQPISERVTARRMAPMSDASGCACFEPDSEGD